MPATEFPSSHGPWLKAESAGTSAEYSFLSPLGRVCDPTVFGTKVSGFPAVPLWKKLELIWGFSPPPLVSSAGGESVELPASCRTRPGLVGTLIRLWTLQHKPCRFVWKASSEPRPPNADTWTRPAVWDRLQSILMSQLNLPREAVHPDATLAGDLMMD